VRHTWSTSWGPSRWWSASGKKQGPASPIPAFYPCSVLFDLLLDNDGAYVVDEVRKGLRNSHPGSRKQNASGRLSENLASAAKSSRCTVTWRKFSGSYFHSARHPRRMFDKGAVDGGSGERGHERTAMNSAICRIVPQERPTPPPCRRCSVRPRNRQTGPARRRNPASWEAC
jgi:hypothetical protein